MKSKSVLIALLIAILFIITACQPGGQNTNQTGESEPNDPGESEPNDPGESEPNDPGESEPGDPGESESPLDPEGPGNSGEIEDGGAAVNPNDPLPDYCKDGNHEFTEWEITKNPDCTTKGDKRRFCHNCPYIENGTVDALGHAKVYHSGVGATCTEEGYKDYETCSRCSDYTTYEKINATGHSLGAWTVSTSAGCTYSGTEKAECTAADCEYYETRTVNALGHDIKNKAAQAATCTEDGWEAYEYCSRCSYTTYEKIPAAHKYSGNTCESCGYDKKLSFTLSADETYYIVSGIGDFTYENEKITIPTTYNNLPVKEIGAYAFAYKSNVVAVTIPNGITSIGSMAFAECTGLATITVPVSVTSIEYGAFAYCSNLSEITLPFVGAGRDTSGYRIHFGYIFGCSTYYTQPSFYHYRSKNPYLPGDLVAENPGADGDGYYYFVYNIPQSLVSVAITDDNAIADEAFKNCTSITQIYLADGVSSLGSTVFSGSTGIVNIVISSSLSTVGANAFDKCESLENVYYYGTDVEWNSIYVSTSGNGKLINASRYYYSSENPGREGSFWYYGNNGEILVWPPHVHNTVFSHKTEPGCYTDGEEIFKCEIDKCDYTETETLPAAHKYDANNVCSVCYDIKPSEGIIYTLSGDRTYYIASQMGFCTDTRIVIANVYNNLPVKEIGTCAFEGNRKITEVVMQSNLTSIGNSAFYGCTSLTKVTLGDNVISIGAAAFNGCQTLSDISIGSNVVTIGNSAFMNCDALVSVTIPGGVTSIGESAFYGCDALTKLTILNSSVAIGKGAFGHCKKLSDIDLGKGVTSIGNSAFVNCSSLVSIIIPDSVSLMGSAVFSGCTALESITLPFVGSVSGASDTASNLFGYIFGSDSYSGGVIAKQYYNHTQTATYYIPGSLKSVTVTGTSIPFGAFSGCTGITNIVIPSSVTQIRYYVFYNCTSLTSGVIHGNVSEIGDYAFYNCTSLDGVIELGNLKKIGNYAFAGCTGIDGVSLENELTSIGDYAFGGCTSIENISVPDSVNTIGVGAFSGCSSLESISLPFVGGKKNATSASASTLFGYVFGEVSYTGGTETVQMYTSSHSATYYIPLGLKSVTIATGEIYYGAFYNCSGITSITLGEITKIENSAFAECVGIESITIPGSVVSIGSSTFINCQRLKTVTIENGVSSIGSAAFAGCTRLMSIFIPESVTSIGTEVFRGCSSLSEITVDKNNDYYKSVNGVLYSKDGKNLVQYPVAKADDSFEIPAGVTQIGTHAFFRAQNLKNVTMGDGITEIGAYAFYSCFSLSDAAIPSSVTKIGASAFYGCSKLTGVVIPNGVTDIPAYAFSWCTRLASVTIGNNVKTIGASAFADCNQLKELVVPECVTSIGASAFAGCTSIESITLPFVGSQKDNSATGSTTYFIYVFGSSIPQTLKSVTITGGKIFNSAFKGVKNITSVTLGSGVSEIGADAFNGCPDLSSVTIEKGLTAIGNYAFKSCFALTSISIPDSVLSIGSYAFDYCQNLGSLTIGNGVTSIGDFAFNNCYNLADISLGGSVKTIGSSSFRGCVKLTGLVLPDSLTNIGTSAFYGCSGITSVTFGTGLTTIGSYAFLGCSGLVEVVIPDSVTTIGSSAFSGCYSIESITIPFVGGSKSIKNESSSTLFGYIFGTASYNGGIAVVQSYSASGSATYYIPAVLKSVTINGGNVRNVSSSGYMTNYIPYGAFYGCSEITSVTINGVGSIGTKAFYGCYKLVEVYNLSGLVITKGSEDNGCLGLYAINIYNSKSEASLIFKTEDGFVFLESSDRCYLLSYEGSNIDIILPESVNGKSYEIYNMAFKNSNVQSIVISNGVTKIGDYAFYGCSALEEIEIGSGVSYIGLGAFGECGALVSATFKIAVGWGVYFDASDETSAMDLNSERVADATVAVTYLKSTAENMCWKRK